MSIHPNTLSSLQSAGQEVFDASEALKSDLQTIAAALVQHVAADPTGQESDSAYQRLKVISALSKELHDVDLVLRGIYGRAASLMAPEVKPPLALGGPKAKVGGDVQDAQVKAMPAPKVPPERQRANRSARQTKRPGSPAPKPKRVLNLQRLFDYLNQAIGDLDGISLKHADLAEGSGIPAGSVSAALKSLIEKGLILEVAAGTYSLPRPTGPLPVSSSS